MNRSQGLEILKTKDGRRYYKTVKYPDIPLSEDDIYVISSFGDRCDLIASDYYQGDTSLYWIIQIANDIPRDSFYIPEGNQTRIPQDITGIIQSYNDLNGIK
jgi:hypothetical protein